MIVNLLLFAAAKEIAGANHIGVEVVEPCTLETLKTALVKEYPELAELANRSAFSVDQAYATDQAEISVNAEVAMIPPVSGG